MKLRFVVPTLALALASLAAHAQIGVYLNPIVSRVSNSKADTGTFAFLGNGETSQIFGGVSLGGYYMFAHGSLLDGGVDVRDEIQHWNSASLNSFMVSPRVVFKPAIWGIKPYAQLGVGAGRTAPPDNTVHTTKFEYGVFAGADKPLGKHVDWRIIEVGYGSLTTTNSSIYDEPTQIPAAKVLNFSAGLVFRFPK